MRLLCLLLSVYVLLLSCFVCSDEVIGADSEQVYVSVSNTEHTTECIDLCSPFCICTCCAGFVSLIRNFDIAKTVQVIKALPVHYEDASLQGFSSAVFQPPKSVLPV